MRDSNYQPQWWHSRDTIGRLLTSPGHRLLLDRRLLFKKIKSSKLKSSLWKLHGQNNELVDRFTDDDGYVTIVETTIMSSLPRIQPNELELLPDFFLCWLDDKVIGYIHRRIQGVLGSLLSWTHLFDIWNIEAWLKPLLRSVSAPFYETVWIRQCHFSIQISYFKLWLSLNLFSPFD